MLVMFNPKVFETGVSVYGCEPEVSIMKAYELR